MNRRGTGYGIEIPDAKRRWRVVEFQRRVYRGMGDEELYPLCVGQEVEILSYREGGRYPYVIRFNDGKTGIACEEGLTEIPREASA